MLSLVGNFMVREAPRSRIDCIFGGKVNFIRDLWTCWMFHSSASPWQVQLDGTRKVPICSCNLSLYNLRATNLHGSNKQSREGRRKTCRGRTSHYLIRCSVTNKLVLVFLDIEAHRDVTANCWESCASRFREKRKSLNPVRMCPPSGKSPSWHKS